MNRIQSAISLTLIYLLTLLAGCKSTQPNIDGGNGNKGSIDQKTVISSVCENAYYPATPSLKRSYKITYAGNRIPPATYTESFSNFASDGYTYQMKMDTHNDKKEQTADMVLESGVRCKAEGLMLLEFANLQLGGKRHMKVKTIKADGITFPNESEWKIGKKWGMKYDIEMEFDKSMAPAMAMNPKGTNEIQWEIVGQESVTVPAGTYDAFKLMMTLKNNLNMGMRGVNVPMQTELKTTSWVAKGVGMVKTVVDKADATTELISFVK